MNPRKAYTFNGFQDRRDQPLCHPSAGVFSPVLCRGGQNAAYMLAILDYKAGNQTSVRRALEHLGIPCAITADPATLEGAHGIIFPGVGAAGQAMRALHPTGLDVLLRECVKRGQPLLGICLGCQILLDRSEENDTTTLGIVPGLCRRFEDNMRRREFACSGVKFSNRILLREFSGLS